MVSVYSRVRAEPPELVALLKTALILIPALPPVVIVAPQRLIAESLPESFFPVILIFPVFEVKLPFNETALEAPSIAVPLNVICPLSVL